MRLSVGMSLLLLTLVAGAGAAASQPPPPPPGGASGPPPKQGTADTDGDRRDDRDNRRGRRAAGGPLPEMDAIAMPDMDAPEEVPVTASGNFDLWRARIAERRNRQAEAGAVKAGATPD